MKPRHVYLLTLLAGFLILAFSAVLTFDYIKARIAAPAEDARVAALQKEVRQDSSRALVLYAEQQRFTKARDARNSRSRFLSWALIAASALFIIGARWLVERQPRPAPIPSRPQSAAPAPASSPAPAPPPATVTSSGPPPIDLDFVDELISREGTAAESAIAILHAIQEHYRYLPDEALLRVHELTEITPAQIAGTSSFYSRFRRDPVGKHIVRVCHGTACHVSGARQITEQLRRDLEIPEGSDTDPHRLFTLEEVACLGCCSLAPVLMVDNHTAGKLTPATARAALDEAHPREPA
jgi:NADH:ubiquinone oxidoreductase subunit E